MTVRLSFNQAFVAHYRRVYRYAYALTCDKGLAEDVVQEVFLHLYQNLAAAQRDGLLRALGRARTRDGVFVAQTIQTNTMALPEAELLRAVEIAETRCVLDKLKEPMRSCLLLKHEGLSYKEIAAGLLSQDAKASATSQEAALGLSARHGGENAWPVLLQAVRNQALAASVREQAIYWIAPQRNEQSLAALIQLYDGKKTPS